MDDATTLAARVAAGEISSFECMQASIAAAHTHRDLGAIARLEAELGLQRAQRFDRARRNGENLRLPFSGVPFLAKDLGGYGEGLMCVAGSKALARRSEDPSDDDALFSAFGTAGLISFGLTTVPEFGLSLTSEPPGGPVARNPFDPSLSPGGSSGGAAAAVAAGIVAIAHATDAAGSIRVPAACCGLVGLKTTSGRVPGAPHFENHLMGIASELVLARSVRDVRAAFEAVRLDTQTNTSMPRHLGVCMPSAASPNTQHCMKILAETLEGEGFIVSEQPSIDALGLEADGVAGTIFAASLTGWLDAMNVPDDEVSPISAAFAARGRSMGAAELYEASVRQARIAFACGNLFDGIDMLITPILADGPPKIGAFDPNDHDTNQRLAAMNRTAPNAALANVGGLPALAMPFGMMPEPNNHIPFGFQILGPKGHDEALLNLALAIERMAEPVPFPHPIAGLS